MSAESPITPEEVARIEDSRAQRTAVESRRNHQKRRLLLILLFLVGGVGLVSAGGFAVVSALEERDSFCTSCHTIPEITYFNRAYLALDRVDDPIFDLATAHYRSALNEGVDFKCITCHRGDASLGHRVSTMALAAYDTLIYLTGHENPQIEKQDTKTGWLANASCSTCHTATLLRLDGINNHFHTYLPEARVALDRGGLLTISDALLKAATERSSGEGSGPSLTLQTISVPLLCSDCHQAHKTQVIGSTTFFMDTDLRNAACVECHVSAQQGPQDVKDLTGTDKD